MFQVVGGGPLCRKEGCLLDCSRSRMEQEPCEGLAVPLRGITNLNVSSTSLKSLNASRLVECFPDLEVRREKGGRGREGEVFVIVILFAGHRCLSLLSTVESILSRGSGTKMDVQMAQQTVHLLRGRDRLPTIRPL